MLTVTKTQIQAVAKAKMLSSWPFKPVSSQMDTMLTSYAEGFADALVSCLGSVSISGATVLGGTSAPGGPLVGGLLTCLPGSLAANTFDLRKFFKPPQFSAVIEGKTYTGDYTPWLRSLTSVLDTCLKQAWSTWYPLWSIASFPCVNGGVSAWIPPAPPAPPLPGPWTGGTISVPVSFNTPGQGVSASPAFKLLSNTIVSVCKATTVTVPIQASEPITTRLCVNETSEKLIRCITDAYSETFDEITKQLVLADAGGASASGTATPPVGAIVGGVLPKIVLR